jgi:pimeloyl-ACP methyl ester carboxylesterase
MTHVRVNGVDLEYVDEGTGIPVVFSHGSASDLRYWEPQRKAFAARYRFVAYSRRFHGIGRWPEEGDYATGAHVADLVAIIRRLEAGPIHLVGFSTALALRVTLREPSLIRRLTIIEPNVARCLRAILRAGQSSRGGGARTSAFEPRPQAMTSAVPSCGSSSSTTEDRIRSTPNPMVSAGCGSTTSA